MPLDEEDEVTPQPTDALQGDGEKTPPEKKPDPAALTRDDITGIIRDSVGSAVSASVHALMQEQQARGTPLAPIEDVTDEDLDNAIAAGPGSAAKIRKAIKAEAERLARSRIDPLAATGGTALRNLALRAARADMPYYDRFKSEIDNAVKNLPPDKAADPDVIVDVHDYLVGKNSKAIMAEERQAWEKERDKPKPTQVSSGRGNLRAVPGKPGSKGGKLTPEDVFDAAALASLGDLGKNKNGRPAGMNFEDFCRNVLGKEPEEYLAEVAKDEGMETGT